MKTLGSVLQTIHRMYEGDTDYPTSGDDFNLRVGFVNDAIEVWAENENTKWKELYKKKTGTTDGTSVIACPSDFEQMASFLKIDESYYEMIKPEDKMIRLANNTSDKFFYVAPDGSGGYQLEINPTPDSGKTYTYYYYKTPSSVSTTTDKIEMSKPMFIVYFVLAKLYELDNRNDLVQYYEQKAFDILTDMTVENEALPEDHISELKDKDYLIRDFAFGK